MQNHSTDHELDEKHTCRCDETSAWAFRSLTQEIVFTSLSPFADRYAYLLTATGAVEIEKDICAQHCWEWSICAQHRWEWSWREWSSELHI